MFFFYIITTKSPEAKATALDECVQIQNSVQQHATPLTNATSSSFYSWDRMDYL